MKAVVLAAGEGSRFRPLTATRPKHMIPLAGRPALEHLLLAILESGISQVILVVGYQHEKIKGYFKDGKKIGLDLSYVHQKKLLGTANALCLTEQYIGDEPFLLVNGDLYIEASLIKSMIQKQAKSGLMKMAVVRVPDPQRFGVINLKNGFVKGIIEKPKPNDRNSNMVNAGIYILFEEVFKEISKTKPSIRDEYEITDTLQRLIERGVSISSEMIDIKNWLDLGRPWDLLEANKRALKEIKREIKGTVEKNVNILGNVEVQEGTRVRSGSYIEGPVILGGRSDIGPNCYIRPFSSIGRDVRIGNACEIKNSIIFNKSHIEHLSYIGDSIVGENCNIGAGTITANLRLDNDKVKVMIKKQMVNSGLRKLGAIIGDNVKTGINVNIMPGVKIGNNAWIGPNVTVARDLEDGVFAEQRENLRFKNIVRG